MGVSQGLDLALRSIINPGDEVIIFEPCYVSYAANISLLHGKPVTLQTNIKDKFKINIKNLRNAITDKTKAILLNYPANPTGATIDYETLSDIAILAHKHNLIIISDEIYSSLTYDKKHISIASIEGMKERTIYLNGFSKSHAMTGWRLGFNAAPKYLMDVMLKIHQYIALCAHSVSQHAAVDAINRGEKYVHSMRSEYKKRRNFLVNSFNEMGLPCLLPEGAFYVFPDITPSGLTSRNFAINLLNTEKVAVVPGNAFGIPGEGHIRCSYATSIENLKESVIRIKRFMKKLK